MQNSRRLTDLHLNGSAKIRAIELHEELRMLLMESGFTPGSAVTRVASGMWGSPGAYEVRGMRMALREEEARGILVEPLS